MHFPSGAKLCVDRGAEQGDPLGSVYYALVLADAPEIVRERLRAKGVDIFDFWSVDDGPVFSRRLACGRGIAYVRLSFLLVRFG